jgi:hypothetical protein
MKTPNGPHVVEQPDGDARGSSPARCYADPTDDPAYQVFVNECAKHCTCQAPWPCPCDGVLAGGLCDQMPNEPDYTLDDLDWHEAYD